MDNHTMITMVTNLIRSGKTDPESVFCAVIGYTTVYGGAYSINLAKAKAVLNELLNNGCELRNTMLALGTNMSDARPVVVVEINLTDILNDACASERA